MQLIQKAFVIYSERFKNSVESVTTVHKELIERSIDGDSSAQAALYKHYAKAMFNVCMRFMHNREDAEDTLQESFVTAFLRLHTFRFESSFGSWIKRIVINNCINSLKKRKLDLTFIDEINTSELREEEDHIPQEDVDLSVQKIKMAMEQLPEGSKMVFNLYLFEGYDHKEIAEILGVTETTSKTQYMRAKRKVVSWVNHNVEDYER